MGLWEKLFGNSAERPKTKIAQMEVDEAMKAKIINLFTTHGVSGYELKSPLENKNDAENLVKTLKNLGIKNPKITDSYPSDLNKGKDSGFYQVIIGGSEAKNDKKDFERFKELIRDNPTLRSV
jgi:hypothetical protein